MIPAIELEILQKLAACGATKAMFFDEDALDSLFKRRPRLIKLLPGHQDAVVDVTSEGMLLLAKSRS